MPPLPGSLVMLFNCMLSFLLSLDSFNKSMWFPLYTSYQSTLIDLHSLAGTIFLIYKSSTIFPTTKHIFCGSLLHTQFPLPHLLSTVCVPLFLWLLCQSQPHCISCGTQAKEDNIQVFLRLSSHLLILDGLSLLPFWTLLGISYSSCWWTEHFLLCIPASPVYLSIIVLWGDALLWPLTSG